MNALAPTELVLLLVVGALYVGSLVWAYRDAEVRDKNGPLVALLVAIAAWPLGLIVWAIARPPVTVDP